jgi:hypothetical protein
MRKVIVVGVLCLLGAALAGVASPATAGDGAPARKIRAGAEALARRIVLKDADFPLGWSREAFGDQQNQGCAGVDYSDLTITGDAGSGFGERRNGYLAFSIAEVYATSAQARNSLMRGSAREIGECVRRNGVGEGENFAVVNMKVSPLPFRKLGDRTRAFVVTFDYDYGSQRVPARLDIVGLQRGRAVAALGFLAVAGPLPRAVEVLLAKQLVARMA